MSIPKKQPIEKLTPEQEAQLPVYADKWTKIGTCTDRADRAAAEAGMDETYAYAKLPPIRFRTWASSPPSMVLAFISSDALEKGVTLNQLETICWPSLPKLPAMSQGILDNARQQVQDFYNFLKNDNKLPKEVADKDALGVFQTALKEFAWQFGYGQHDANWLAFYEFFKDVCGLVEETESLTGLWEVAKASGWYLPYTSDDGKEGRVWHCERQTALHLDDRGRMHCTTGPAISFEDGTKIYYIAGVHITKPHIVESPKDITIEEIEKEPNAEVKRVMVDMYESERAGRSRGDFILNSGAVAIHRDEFGILYKKQMQGDEDMVFVQVDNSTPEPDGSIKKYMLRVPPTITRAKQAIAWTFDLKEEEYAPLVET